MKKIAEPSAAVSCAPGGRSTPGAGLLTAVLVGQWCYGSAVGFYANYVVLTLLAVWALWYTFNGLQRAFQISALLTVYVGLNLALAGAAPDGQAINLLLWVALVPATARLASGLPAGDVGKALARSQLFGLALMSVDTVLRLAFPTPPTETLEFIELNPNSMFYAYKFGGFMFSEANTFGLCALALYISLRLVRHPSLGTGASVWALVLVLSSFSRTAVGAVLLFELLRQVRWLLKPIGFGTFLGYCLLVNAVPILLLDLVPDDFDGSGQTKLMFLALFADHLIRADLWTVLFGIGLGNSIESMGYYLHNFFILALLEIGVLGTLFMLWLMFWALNRNGLRPLLVIYPLAGLSYLFMLAAPPLLLTPLVSAVLLDRLSRHLRASSRERATRGHANTGTRVDQFPRVSSG